MNISVIIPSTCSEKVTPLLSDCLRSLTDHPIKEINLKTTVISNYKENSKNTNSLLSNNIYFVERDNGFGEMNNYSIEKSIKYDHPDYILFINDDTRVNKSFFKELLKLLKKSERDIIIPLVYSGNGKNIDSYGLKYFSSGYSSTINKLNEKSKIASGSCFIAKKTFLEKMKNNYGFYFNPIFHYYYEDTEFSLRANCLGAKIIRSKNIIAYHHGSQSTKDKSYFKYFYSYRNIIWVIIITWPLLTIVKNFFKILTLQILVFIMLTYHFGIKIYMNITWETFRNINKLIALRRNIQDKYLPEFDFDSLLDKHIFCTKRGRCF